VTPGAHVAILSEAPSTAIEGRLRGLELRDTLLILRPGPRVGFLFLFRAPLAEAGVTAQVMATGTGAIHVDACRVAYASEADKTPTVGKSGDGGLNPGIGANLPQHKPNWGAWHVKDAGRWPPNVLFVHGPDCKRVGSRQVKTSMGTVGALSARQGGIMGKLGTRKDAGAACGYGDEDGLETVAAYECEPTCPVLLLDAQSGVTTSGAMKREVPAYSGSSSTAFLRGRSGPSNQHGDTGGASRFYPQFASEDELLAWVSRLTGA
jgi:hypothetical protein